MTPRCPTLCSSLKSVVQTVSVCYTGRSSINVEYNKEDRMPSRKVQREVHPLRLSDV